MNKKALFAALLISLTSFGEPLKASGDFGDADFREDIEAGGPRAITMPGVKN